MRVVGRRDRAMPLVAAHVGHARAERQPPLHGVPPIAGVTEKQGIGDLRNVLPDHVRVAAEAVAGQHQGAATDVLPDPIRAPDAHAGHLAVLVRVEVGGDRVRQEVDAFARDALQKAGEQLRAIPVGGAVHAVLAVTRVEEVGQQLQRRTVRVDEPVHGHGRAAGDGERHFGVGAMPRLLQDLRSEFLRRVLDARRLLELRAGGGDLTAGQRRAARRRIVALDHENARTAFACGQRRAAAARAGADHDDGNGGVKPAVAGSDDSCRCVHHEDRLLHPATAARALHTSCMASKNPWSIVMSSMVLTWTRTPISWTRSSSHSSSPSIRSTGGAPSRTASAFASRVKVPVVIGIPFSPRPAIAPRKSLTALEGTRPA